MYRFACHKCLTDIRLKAETAEPLRVARGGFGLVVGSTEKVGLSRTHHHNHSPAFYATLSRHMPDWKRIKMKFDNRVGEYLLVSRQPDEARSADAAERFGWSIWRELPLIIDSETPLPG